MHSDKIAVDIVLLPDDNMTEEAIRINREMSSSCKNEITLNKKNTVPHITIAMGCMKKEDSKFVIDIIKDAKKMITSKELFSESDNSEKCWIKIQKTEMLKNLHAHILEKTKNRFSYEDAEGSMFFTPPSPWKSYIADWFRRDFRSDKMKKNNPRSFKDKNEEINSLTINYLKNFLDKSAFDNYNPHITLGSNAPSFQVSLGCFNAKAICLFQLGNYCTCKKMLHCQEL